jgi:drug/metabolite transporter (DMT)-like permease
MGILLALASSISWGSGDFSGGIASRRISPYQVLFLVSTSSLILLVLAAVFRAEGVPSVWNIFVSLLAGIFGGAGLLALYRGLSTGYTSVVAPVAGVIGAIVPMLTGMLLEGLPGVTQLSGFGVALAGIWLVSSGDNHAHLGLNGSLGLALLAGIGFGGFLALIPQIEGDQIFSPLVVSKLASLLFAVLLLRGKKLPLPPAGGIPVAILSGFLDAGGNIFYLAASQYARLDIVAMLSSLYPAVTVMLSAVLLKERVTTRSWLGALVCIIAIVLITH